MNYEEDREKAQALHDRLLWESRTLEIMARAPCWPTPEPRLTAWGEVKEFFKFIKGAFSWR